MKNTKHSSLILNPNPPESNQLYPQYHPYLYELYKNGVSNNWSPAEIDLKRDREEFFSKDKLSDKEKLLVQKICELFCAGESIVSNNIGTNIFKYITNGEARQYLTRHGYEEAVHNETIMVLIEAFDLDENEVYFAYEKSEAVKAFADTMRSKRLSCENLDMSKTEDIQTFVRLMVSYYLLTEGLFFYGCFCMGMSFGRRGVLRGFSKLIALNARDEVNHVNSGIYLINKIKEQNPDIWTKDFQDILIQDMKEGLELANKFNKEAIPEGILGFNHTMLEQYMQFIANDRLASINLPFRFKNADNPFPWLSEQLDLQEMANFFEEKVVAYQNKSMLEDDF